MGLSLKVPGCGLSKINEGLPSTAGVQMPCKTDVPGWCEMQGISKAAAHCNLSGYESGIVHQVNTCWGLQGLAGKGRFGEMHLQESGKSLMEWVNGSVQNLILGGNGQLKARLAVKIWGLGVWMCRGKGAKGREQLKQHIKRRCLSCSCLSTSLLPQDLPQGFTLVLLVTAVEASALTAVLLILCLQVFLLLKCYIFPQCAGMLLIYKIFCFSIVITNVCLVQYHDS